MKSLTKALVASSFLVSFIASPALAEEASPELARTVLNKISANAVYPQSAELKSQEGVVTLAMTLDQAGFISDVAVLQSSGSPSLDKAALRAAVVSAPYPTKGSDTTEVKGRIRFTMSN